LERIDLKPSFTLENKANAPVTITVKSQDGKGTAWFDNAAGRLREMVNHTVTELERDQMGLIIPLRSVQTTTVRLIEGK
ncbi:MAG: hypothetical protein NZO58_11245, partial [Gemmataceae bacterium]|nr:hypothetical protein [Gemmataceae bacterium]